VFEGFAALRGQLTSKSSLTKREQAVIVCATAARLGDSYCSLAWGRTLSDEAGAAYAAAVISSDDGVLGTRDRALAVWARKVVADPNGTTASDVEALRSAGFNDRTIFEATAFIAFRVAFSTVNDALGVAPDWQLAESVPREVADVVTFGRLLAACGQDYVTLASDCACCLTCSQPDPPGTSLLRPCVVAAGRLACVR
jgi:alkylhydroperoxidase family enzyme